LPSTEEVDDESLKAGTTRHIQLASKTAKTNKANNKGPQSIHEMIIISASKLRTKQRTFLCIHLLKIVAVCIVEYLDNDQTHQRKSKQENLLDLLLNLSNVVIFDFVLLRSLFKF
jgi:hypothetical protein